MENLAAKHEGADLTAAVIEEMDYPERWVPVMEDVIKRLVK